jgi:hypothetical protein
MLLFELLQRGAKEIGLPELPEDEPDFAVPSPIAITSGGRDENDQDEWYTQADRDQRVEFARGRIEMLSQVTPSLLL